MIPISSEIFGFFEISVEISKKLCYNKLLIAVVEVIGWNLERFSEMTH